ncbi:MAG: glycosyl transferase family 2 [Bacilli bacterium]|nr:glycosyl transferase family 2 [Bacilli bacterium]
MNKKRLSGSQMANQKHREFKGASAAGFQSYRNTMSLLSDMNLKKELNHQWWRWFSAKKVKRFSWRAYHSSANRFKFAFLKKTKRHIRNWVLIPTTKKVAAILSVMNEEKTIRNTLDQLERLPLEEIIVVINGSTDQTLSRIQDHPSRPLIIHYDTALGFDVGRAVGAKAAISDILLFLDGDMVIRAEQLVPFVYEVERGTDIALNNITPFLARFDHQDSVTVIKQFVNHSLGRSDLSANSLTAIPHALSRRAVETIGCHNLAIPPLAQAIALQAGMKVTAPTSIDVIQKNRKKSTNSGRANVVEGLIIGDHLEALHYSMERQGERLHLQDIRRKRQCVGGTPNENEHHHSEL